MPRQKIPIDCPARSRGMTKIDDLLQSWAKQVVLTVVARLAHRSPRQRISPSKKRPNQGSQNARNRGAHQASCKIGYLLTSNPADQSTASEFFTGDHRAGDVRCSFCCRSRRRVELPWTAQVEAAPGARSTRDLGGKNILGYLSYIERTVCLGQPPPGPGAHPPSRESASVGVADHND